MPPRRRALAQPGRFRLWFLEFEASSFDEYVSNGGGRGLERALAMAPREVIEEVALSGLRGRGGAGFPTATKWAALHTGTGPRYVVCILTFEEEFRSHAGRECPSPRGLVLPKIVDWDEEAGRFGYDDRYERKRPDWTYSPLGES